VTNCGGSLSWALASGRNNIGGVTTFYGAGTPEGALAAVVGCQYLDTTAGQLWQKTSGAGNTGWNPVAYNARPANQQAGNYQLVLTDQCKTIVHISGAAHAWTVPPAAAVNFPSDTVIEMTNGIGGGVITITPGAGVSLCGTAGAIGAKTLTAPGYAILRKLAGDTWSVWGPNVSP
jgi:hypothetical protein